MAFNPFERLPELPLRHVFGLLTPPESHQTESVSRCWQSYVDMGLQQQTRFCSVELSQGVRILNSNDIERLLRRMCDPLTGKTNLKHLNLRYVSDPETGYFSAVVDTIFPNLATLILETVFELPSFVKHCKNLHRFECGDISWAAFSTILTEFPSLKVLKFGHIAARDTDGLVYEVWYRQRWLSYSASLGFSVQTQYEDDQVMKSLLSSSSCSRSLDSLSICALQRKGMEMLSEAYPNVTELSLSLVHQRHHDLRPVASLRLRRLELDVCCRYSGDPLLPQLFNPSPVFASGARLSDTLEELSLHWRSHAEAPDDDANLLLISGCRKLRILSLSSAIYHQPDDPEEDDHHEFNFSCLSSYFTAERFPLLEDLKIPCVKLGKVAASGNWQLPNLKRFTFCACRANEEFLILQFTAEVTRSFPTLNYLRLEGLRINRELFYRFAGSLRNDRSLHLEIAVDRLCRSLLAQDSDSDWRSSCESYSRALQMEAGSLGLVQLKFSFPSSDGHAICRCSPRGIRM